MGSGFGIDTVFADATRRMRDAVGDVPVESLTLHGSDGALLPQSLIVRTPRGSVEVEIDQWPDDVPATREDLRADNRAWSLFTREWSRSEIAEYLGVSSETSEASLHDAFVESDWWREFEDMVAAAFRYEWRAALEALRRRWNGSRVFVAQPDPQEVSLQECERRLAAAASRFEASSVDAQLLYNEAARVAKFLVRSADEAVGLD